MDKSKKNEHWVWWVDAKTGKAEWISFKENGITTVKDGRYTRFYFNGNVYEKGRLVNGIDVDTIFDYDLTGRLQAYEIPEKDSIIYFIINGPIKTFYADGKLRATGIIEKHTFGSKWYHYFEDGKPIYIKDLSRDTGWATKYYHNGRVKDSDYFEGDKSFTIKHWYESGQLEESFGFKNGDFNGIFKQYFQNGQLKRTGNMVDGQETGEDRMWYDDGKILAVGHFINKLLEGKQVLFYKNGTIELEGFYSKGKPNGEFKKYNETGKLLSDKIFKDGVMIAAKKTDSSDFFSHHQ